MKKTLIDVLERRQVTFANQDLVAPPPARHRRYQSELLDNHIGVDTPRPSSAPSSGDTQQSSSNSRPTLQHNRGTSYGSRRNLLQRSPASLRRSNRSSTGDWVGGAENGSDNPAATYQRDNRPRLASLPTVNYPTRSSRHHRGKSGNVVYVRSDSSGSQASSLISGLTTPGERARYVALQMKMAAGSNNTEDTIGVNANLPDLMNAIEAQRESDDLSNGNQHRSAAGSSRDSQSESRAAKSKSSTSSGGYRYRPFSGISSSPFSHGGRNASNGVDQLFQVAERVQELCQIEEENEASDDDDNDGVKLSNSIVLEEENANFLTQIAASHPSVPNVYAEDNVDDGAVDTEATVDEQTPILSKRLSRIAASRRRPPASLFDSITKPNPDSRFYKVRQWLNGFRNRFKMLILAFNFPFVTERMWGFTQNELTMFIVPALAVSYFFFYQMNNPTLFKTEASISWWILFCLRHYCTFLLACVSQYIFVDVMALQSMLSIQMIGPLATLYTINGKGWPFVLTAWGVINLLLIQENSDSASSHHFFSHWLYYTDVELFSAENPSGNGKCIQSTTTYHIFLVSFFYSSCTVLFTHYSC